MPAHTRRAIDPTPEQLAALFGDAYRHAARDAPASHDPREPASPYDDAVPSWGELLRHAAERPEGVYARRYRADWQTGPVIFGACWWADVLGRRHWLAQADSSGEAHTVGSAAEEFGQGDGLIQSRHPLEWIAPDLASGWRQRGGRWELVIVCRCGYAGTPESLAWTGSLCGPCFDREQEGIPPAGLPPLRPDVGRIDHFELTPGGRLLGTRWGVDAASHLRVWNAPSLGKPRWGREWTEVNDVAVSPAGLVAVGTAPGRITLVGLDDGKTRDSRDAGGNDDLRRLGFAGKDGERLIALFSIPGQRHRFYLRAWGVTPGGALGEPLYLREQVDMATFDVSPRGQRLLVSLPQAVEVRDSETCDVIERLKLPAAGRVRSARALADGAAIASTYMDDRHPPRLHRWNAKPAATSRGWLGWGALGRVPDTSADLNGLCEAVVPTPDGRLLASAEDVLVLRDAVTLQQRGRFRPARCELLSSLAFTADGQLLALTDRGLAAWPWREVFGV